MPLVFMQSVQVSENDKNNVNILKPLVSGATMRKRLTAFFAVSLIAGLCFLSFTPRPWLLAVTSTLGQIQLAPRARHKRA